MTLYPKLILDALATVRYPGNGKNLVEAEMIVDNMRIDGMSVSFSILFDKPTDPFRKSVVKAAETAIQKRDKLLCIGIFHGIVRCNCGHVVITVKL